MFECLGSQIAFESHRSNPGRCRTTTSTFHAKFTKSSWLLGLGLRFNNELLDSPSWGIFCLPIDWTSEWMHLGMAMGDRKTPLKKYRKEIC